jgi:hypothetical protein
MRPKSKKKITRPSERLTRPRARVESRAYRQDYPEPRLHDASSGGAYFMNQANRLRSLAGTLATLTQDLYDQADDLRWELKTIESFIENHR